VLAETEARRRRTTEGNAWVRVTLTLTLTLALTLTDGGGGGNNTNVTQVLFTACPVLHLQPCLKERLREARAQASVYHCPLYKTTARRGVLSTTGHSTNFVVDVPLRTPVPLPAEHWVARGVCLHMQLDF